MMAACGATINATDHPGMWLGAIMGSLAADGQDKVTIQTSPSIAAFGNWIEQLIAESTGKEGRGLLPVVGATVGMPHDYSTDRLFVYLRVDGDDNAETDAGITTLQQAGQPCVTLHLDDNYALGGEFFRWEYATAIAGKILDINPFDEPNVTESKNNTSKLLDYYQGGRQPAADQPADRRRGGQPVCRRAHGEDALRPLLAAPIPAQYHDRADRRAVERQPGGRLLRAAGLSPGYRRESTPSSKTSAAACATSRGGRSRLATGRATCTARVNCTRAGRTTASLSRSPCGIRSTSRSRTRRIPSAC